MSRLPPSGAHGALGPPPPPSAVSPLGLPLPASGPHVPEASPREAQTEKVPHTHPPPGTPQRGAVLKARRMFHGLVSLV